jgi:sulfite exporter TauE/SafE
MTEILAGLALGAAGSLHCVAMCGPLVLALRPARTPARVALYHAARVTVYAAAGAIGGAIGQTSQIVGIGRMVSIAAGFFLLGLAVRRAGLAVAPAVGDRVSRLLPRLIFAVRRLIGDRPLVNVIAAGALNALLPCGLVYAALAAATAFGSAASAVSFMLAFGLGTVPALAAVSLLARSVSSAARARLRFAPPFALALVGVLLIVRGTVTPHAHAMNPEQPAHQIHIHRGISPAV